MTTINDPDDFQALEPFFRIIEQGLDGLADGGHFFARIHRSGMRVPSGP